MDDTTVVKQCGSSDQKKRDEHEVLIVSDCNSINQLNYCNMKTEIKKVSPTFPAGYGQFPYIIIRMSTGIYRQLPVRIGTKEKTKVDYPCYVQLINKGNRPYNKLIQSDGFIDELKSILTEVHERTKLRCCLVLSPTYCYYAGEQETLLKSETPPLGGVLVSYDGRFIQIKDKMHYKTKNYNTKRVM